MESPSQRLDNDRVSLWEFGPPAEVRRRAHRHPREAVVVSFDAAGVPRVRYVDRGTAHETDVEPGTTRTFVFEIK